jgi:hypothetical protein
MCGKIGKDSQTNRWMQGELGIRCDGCCEPLFGRAGELDGGFNIECYGMVIVCKIMQRYEYGVPGSDAG